MLFNEIHAIKRVYYAAVLCLVTQRALRDETKNGCAGDYLWNVLKTNTVAFQVYHICKQMSSL